MIDSVEDLNFVSLISEIASVPWDDDKIEEETRKSVKLILQEKSKRIRNRLQKELATAEAEGNQSKADEILQQLRSYGLDAKKDSN